MEPWSDKRARQPDDPKHRDVPEGVQDLPRDAQDVYLSAYETARTEGWDATARGGLGRNEFAQQEAWKAVHQEFGDHPTKKHVAHHV